MNHNVRWTQEKIDQRLKLIEGLVYRQRQTLPSFRYLPLPGPLTPPFPTADDDSSEWAVIEPYSYWARARTNFVMRTTFKCPADWADAPLALYLPLGEPGSFSHPEALIYIDGVPLAGTDRHHQEVMLPPEYADGADHRLVLHGWSGNKNQQGDEARLYMRPCELVQIDPLTRDFVALARTAVDVAGHLGEHDLTRSKLLTALDEAFKLLDTREPFGSDFYHSVPDALDSLRSGIAEAGQSMDVSIAAAGHAHIDVAWLWTLGQTRRKSERTFHTVIHLMKQFPNYKFTQSQPQLYDYIRQDHPALFESIKAQVAADRWEPIGGMWVEADCNLSGSEALVRQFLLGRHFFREHFGEGKESPILWLPDVFGYAWALPQIIKKAGLDYFMTIKIAWNQYNRFPFDSFWWQGLDGTRVLTHFSPTPENGVGTKSTYNAAVRPHDGLETWANFLQNDVQTDLLMSFGYGDGGGGPTREMLENIGNLADFPGVPRMRHDKVINFFRKMDDEIGERLPTWNGELYLEYHRGTYTGQARNKLANRRSELSLHDLEFLAVLAAAVDDRYTYPANAINAAWETVCLNQFHDILPGSSIHDVYVELQAQYAEVAESVATLRETALEAVAGQMAGDVLLINPVSFARNDLALWPDALPENQHLETAQGIPLPVQTTAEGTLIDVDSLPPYSVTALSLAEGAPTAAQTGLTASEQSLENDFLRLELTPEGDIARIYDKPQDRELLPPGALANQFQAFEDRPMRFDAWDIDIYYDDRMWLSAAASRIELVESGPLRATIEVERQILNSPYTQRISLFHNSPEIRVETVIEWNERHILLKTAFPVDILAPTATYDIQWGNVERPTHRNTSWDWARFETCAHKWVDLSEADYGVSLLNDCKYGHDIHDNVIRLSLLTSAAEPDPQADLGQHRFSYSLLPHAGTWRDGTIPAAYALNEPIIVAQGSGQSGISQRQLCWTDSDHVVIETVKRAENGEGIIVRLYENQRKRGTVTLETGIDLASAILTNLIEDDEQEIPVDGRRVSFAIKPYEIVTLRLLPA